MGKKQPYKLEKSVSTLSTLVRVIWVVGPCYESIIKFPHGLAREKSYTPKFVTFLPFLFVTANRTFALNRNLRIRQQHLTPLLYFILLNWPHCFIWSWHYGCHLFFVRWIFLLWIITFVLESPMSFLRKYRKKVQIVNIRETEIKLKWNWRNQKKEKEIDNISIGLNNRPTMLYGLNKPPPSPLLEHVFDSISTQNTFYSINHQTYK